MELKDYSTEELKQELQRRYLAAKRKRCKARKGVKYEYATTTGRITWVSDDPFIRRRWRVKILDKNLVGTNSTLYDHEFSLIKSGFNSKTAPRLGDIVLIKSIITKSNPTGFGVFCKPRIYQVIKRKEELDDIETID